MTNVLLLRRNSSSITASIPSVVTVGNFDGLHRGHQLLIGEVVRRAQLKKARAVVVSFYPHPSVVLKKAERIPSITSTRQKLKILGDLGVDLLYLIHFTKQFSQRSVAEFVDSVLLTELATLELVVGPDARIGRGREGTPEVINSLLNTRGASCSIVNFLTSADVVISSRRIRELIGQGQVEEASLLLGRPYRLDGLVIRGDGRGSRLGFPTANLALRGQILPKNGVYAGWATFEGQRYRAVTNIGIRPSFGGSEVRVESHLFEAKFDELYGRHIEVEISSRLREEIKFTSVDLLLLQINKDIEQARSLLK